MTTDAFGEELRVGHFVGYISGGRFPTILKGEVVEIRKQVKVRVTKKIEGCADEFFWVNAHRCVRTKDNWTPEKDSCPTTTGVNVTVHVTGGDLDDVDLLEALRKASLSSNGRSMTNDD